LNTIALQLSIREVKLDLLSEKFSLVEEERIKLRSGCIPQLDSSFFRDPDNLTNEDLIRLEHLLKVFI
jgi:hypothetical protein